MKMEKIASLWTATWTPEIERDLKKAHNIDIKKEIIGVLKEEYYARTKEIKNKPPFNTMKYKATPIFITNPNKVELKVKLNWSKRKNGKKAS